LVACASLRPQACRTPLLHDADIVRVAFQAVPFTAATVALAVFASAQGALLVAVTVATVGMLFGIVYLAQRGERERSPERRRLDRFVGVLWLVVALVSGGVALGLVVTDTKPVGQGDHVALTLSLAFLTTAFAVIFFSSLGDWYFTLPRLGGIVCDPPCVDPSNPRWERVTRAWYGHRFFAALTFIGCFAAVAGSLIGGAVYHVLADHTPPDQTWPVVAAAIGGLATPAFAVVAAFSHATAGEFLRNIARAASLAVYPRHRIGDYVEVRWAHGDPQTGYVLDVALEGFKIRLPSTARSAASIRATPVPHQLTLEGHVLPARGRYCNRRRCLGLNVPYCELWKNCVRTPSR
jgi:hypothetical protein